MRITPSWAHGPPEDGATFSVQPDLPDGLSLNAQTGELRGRPRSDILGGKSELKSVFTISATNWGKYPPRRKGECSCRVLVRVTPNAPGILVYGHDNGIAKVDFCRSICACA